MSLDVTIIYKKPKMVKYNATHAVCGSTYMIVSDDVATEETEWSANITHNMSRMATQVPICIRYRNKEYKGTLYDYVGISNSKYSSHIIRQIAFKIHDLADYKYKNHIILRFWHKIPLKVIHV